MRDSDIESNRAYTNAARVLVGDKASDYVPLGNVTTPADTPPPVIVLLEPANMTTGFGLSYEGPGYDAYDAYENFTDSVRVTGKVNTGAMGA